MPIRVRLPWGTTRASWWKSSPTLLRERQTLVRLNLTPPTIISLGRQRRNPECPLKNVALHLLFLSMEKLELAKWLLWLRPWVTLLTTKSGPSLELLTSYVSTDAAAAPLRAFAIIQPCPLCRKHLPTALGRERQCRCCRSMVLILLPLWSTVPLTMTMLVLGGTPEVPQFLNRATFLLLRKADTGGQMPVLELAMAKLWWITVVVIVFTVAL